MGPVYLSSQSYGVAQVMAFGWGVVLLLCVFGVLYVVQKGRR